MLLLLLLLLLLLAWLKTHPNGATPVACLSRAGYTVYTVFSSSFVSSERCAKTNELLEQSLENEKKFGFFVRKCWPRESVLTNLSQMSLPFELVQSPLIGLTTATATARLSPANVQANSSLKQFNYSRPAQLFPVAEFKRLQATRRS